MGRLGCGPALRRCIIVPRSSGGGRPIARVLQSSARTLQSSTRTTPRTPAELQASKETARSLAARYDLTPKTVREVAQADHDCRCVGYFLVSARTKSSFRQDTGARLRRGCSPLM